MTLTFTAHVIQIGLLVKATGLSTAASVTKVKKFSIKID